MFGSGTLPSRNRGAATAVLVPLPVLRLHETPEPFLDVAYARRVLRLE